MHTYAFHREILHGNVHYLSMRERLVVERMRSGGSSIFCFSFSFVRKESVEMNEWVRAEQLHELHRGRTDGILVKKIEGFFFL